MGLDDSAFFETARWGGDIPDGQVELDGIRYWSQPIKEMRSEHDGCLIVFQGHEVVNECDKCHRADTRPRQARSWAEAIEKGWVVRVCNYEDASSAADIAANEYVARFECGVVVLIGNLKGLPRAAVPARHPWLPHECTLEQIPNKETTHAE